MRVSSAKNVSALAISSSFFFCKPCNSDTSSARRSKTSISFKRLFFCVCAVSFFVSSSATYSFFCCNSSAETSPMPCSCPSNTARSSLVLLNNDLVLFCKSKSCKENISFNILVRSVGSKWRNSIKRPCGIITVRLKCSYESPVS